MVQFLLSPRKSLNIRREVGRASLPVYPAEKGTDAGISNPTAYKQNLIHLQQIAEVPSVVSSHILGNLRKKLIFEVLEKESELLFEYLAFALQICEGLMCKLFICDPLALLRPVTGDWYCQFCCQTFPSKR
jgi:hypothetical protein